MMARAVDEPLRIARNQLSAATSQWVLHLKVCRQCRPLTAVRNRYCIEGWAMVTTMRQLRQQLAALAGDYGDGQGTLF